MGYSIIYLKIFQEDRVMLIFYEKLFIEVINEY